MPARRAVEAPQALGPGVVLRHVAGMQLRVGWTVSNLVITLNRRMLYSGTG